MREYRIRYGIIDPDQIANDVLVANPAYGKPIGKYGSYPVDARANGKLPRLRDFFTRLEHSILKIGVRNPIFCQSITEGTFVRYGVSRLHVCKKHGIHIPAVIADYVDRWTSLDLLDTEADIRGHYIDQPELIEINNDTMRIDKCPPI